MQAEFVSEKLHELSNKIAGLSARMGFSTFCTFKAINHIIYLVKNCFHEVGMTIALHQAVVKGIRVLV